MLVCSHRFAYSIAQERTLSRFFRSLKSAGERGFTQSLERDFLAASTSATDRPALHLAGVGIIELQDVFENYHGFCADDESERLAQGFSSRRLELILGGFECGLDQGRVAVLARGDLSVVLVRHASLQGMHEHP
jgi:hypothetical protein